MGTAVGRRVKKLAEEVNREYMRKLWDSSGDVFEESSHNGFFTTWRGGQIGALFIDTRNDVNWAISIRNIGTQITTYADTREKLPLEVLIGVSQLMENVPIRWHLTLENMQQWQLAFSNP